MVESAKAGLARQAALESKFAPLATKEPVRARNQLPYGVILRVAYDGRNYSGLARQANARTIAGELEGAIRELDPRASLTRCVSRTDAGVHARDQVVAFDTERDINARGWVLGLLQHLPDEISIVRAARVPPGFEPRAVVSRKRYRYTILQSHVRDPFLAGRAWRVYERLNHSAVEEASQLLLGEHDFAAFRGAQDPRVDTVRRLFRIQVTASCEDPRVIYIDVEGDRFLYKMVRIIVGALVDIGRGRLEVDAVRRALESGLRTDLGITAPPDGLCLEAIELDTLGAEFWPGD